MYIAQNLKKKSNIAKFFLLKKHTEYEDRYPHILLLLIEEVALQARVKPKNINTRLIAKRMNVHGDDAMAVVLQ